jgi:hypothetical protein
MPETNHQKFARLYPQYLAGRKWLDQRKAAGLSVEQDTIEFTEQVIWPLHQLELSMAPREQQEIKKIMRLYETFNGKSITFQPDMFQKGGESNGAK